MNEDSLFADKNDSTNRTNSGACFWSLLNSRNQYGRFGVFRRLLIFLFLFVLL